jgi:plasmid stability protein
LQEIRGALRLPGFILRDTPHSKTEIADVFNEAPMATLHVKNISRDQYAALRKRAKSNQRSIAAEVRSILKENVPTAREMKARHKFMRKILRLRAKQPKSSGPFQSAEEMIREDRER